MAMATVKLAPFCLGRSKGPPPEESRAEASDTLGVPMCLLTTSLGVGTSILLS